MKTDAKKKPAALRINRAPAFLKLAKQEPKLRDLLDAIIQARKDSRGRPHVCANALWYGTVMNTYSFKDRLYELVGWGRGDTVQKSPGKTKGNLRTIPKTIYGKPLPPLPTGSLGTSEAYDLCYSYLHARLPRCRKCLCLGVRK
jgi:hypothetical protein